MAGSTIITSLIFLAINSVVLSVSLPCSYISGECQTKVKKGEDQNIVLEVSCHCQYRRDVSKNLTALFPILCPKIPKTADDEVLHKTFLKIQNCDIIEETFPLGMLRILRRSEKFNVSIEDVGSLRLDSDKHDEGATPAIKARFVNSHISGIGKGWFSGSKNLELKFENSYIGVLESEFIGNHETDAEVDVKFINTDIRTVKSFAFHIPKNGHLEFQGGNISQLESDAIDGGESISFDGSRIAKIQTKSINTFGLESFKMEACLVAEIDSDAVVQHDSLSHSDTSVASEHSFGKVKISGNKFMKMNSEAFASLCMEEELIFENNFLTQVSSSPSLQSRHCSVNRKWWTSVTNTGFKCTKCRNLFTQLNEQVCVMYESGWCICDEESNPTTWNTTIHKDKYGNKVPCQINFRDYVSKQCSEDEKSQEYLQSCKKYAEHANSISPRSNPHLQNLAVSQTRLSAIMLMVLVCVVLGA